ncbi:NAD(P)-binding protein [Xanthobacter dioxanivorans]|uniref:NAD(P)-binding protein n=1 Tax=Xanthobacter dioxanivorans TaxID=2528964 RepID=UPI001933D7D5|nr:NAD(P)-binding protein [Xanthobacter dioxanivorans]
MRIIVNGGGPSGLYLAILARKTLDADVTVFEQNPKDATFGFGIVLADRGMERLRHADEESHDRILESCFVSRHRVVRHMGESIFIEGGDTVLPSRGCACFKSSRSAPPTWASPFTISTATKSSPDRTPTSSWAPMA